MNNFPTNCPCCDHALAVTKLRCDQCDTEVGGHYPLTQFLLLAQQDQDFVMQFVETSGSLKEMAKRLGVSYPTVRNRLNEVIEKLQQFSSENRTETTND